MYRKIILLLFICLLATSTCFAGKPPLEQPDDKYNVMINQTKIYAKDLVVTDGADEYAGYLKMSGYPGDDKFQIYFQDNSHDNITSYHMTYVDLRGIDLNENFYFTYEGTPRKMTRGQVNTVFLLFPRTDFECFLKQTFPGAYNDWFEAQAFSSNAERLVRCYIEYKHKVNVGPIHGNTSSDVVLDNEGSSNSDDLDGVVHQGWL